METVAMRSPMQRFAIGMWMVVLSVCLAAGTAAAAEGADAVLPTGVKAVWDMAKAYQESTPTRGEVCINGLWRFKPADSYTEGVPAAGTGWGFFKVPGPWPGHGGQGQTIYSVENWGGRLDSLDACWYLREIQVPAEWQGRRIGLRADDVDSYATVFIDGTEVGSIVFPGADLDITAACKPGQTQQLAIRVVAQGLNAENTNYVSNEPAPNNWTRLSYRGLCGDVFLTSAPAAERITDVKIDTSVRKWRLTVDASLAGLQADKVYTLRARVLDHGTEVLTAESDPFTSADLENGRRAFDAAWHAPKLWDTDTPENMYDLVVTLTEDGTAIDSYYPVHFGFREFWIDGRDFILNGSPVHLRALPLNSAMRGPIATLSAYDGACETLKRMQWLGFNIVYGHNYGCSPGSHVSYAEVLKAADDTGMLFSFSLPNMNSYNWRGLDEKANGYERHIEWYVRRAENHPSVVMFAQNHNLLFVRGMDNPERLPLVLDSDPVVASRRTDVIYGRERILRQFDTTHPVYNHGGWSRELFTMNCYLNWVPMQERAEWVQLWSESGVRPLFMVEYGEPTFMSFLALRDSASGNILHQLFFPEWGAAVRGDEAFQLSGFEQDGIRWEAERWRQNQPFQTWAYPHETQKAGNIANLIGVQAEFIANTWPYFRTFGLSGFNIWSEWSVCHLRAGVSPGRLDYKVDWDNLQRPGISADFSQFNEPDGPFYSLLAKKDDWIPNWRGEALLRYNRPLLAYVAGRPSRFTAKDHNYLPGESIEKQLVVINGSRRPVDCDCQWSFGLPQAQTGQQKVRVEPGRQVRVPIRMTLPDTVAAGSYKLTAKASFSTGEVQDDSFTIDVLAPSTKPEVSGKVAVFDPKGETTALLSGLGVNATAVAADADLAGYDLLVIGKGALTVDGPAPDLSRVRDGLKVLVFEQTSEALEQRLGFRVEEFGERQAYRRIDGHPALAGLANENLHDWRGEATLVPPRLPLPKMHTYEMVEWCGFSVRRPPRCGGYGNVSSVMIEKPGAGDFLPLIDCGFGLKYSPLMLYREGKGMVLFCQVDVTGRTEDEPAATKLAGNILRFADSYTPPAQRGTVYAGEQAGLDHLKTAGVAAKAFDGQPLTDDQVLVVGPGGGEQLAAGADSIRGWVQGGGRVLALGLSQQEAQPLLPFQVRMEQKEHISSYFGARGADSLLAGVGCGDLLVRAPQERPLVTGGAEIAGDGALAQAEGANVVFDQIVPWRFDYAKLYNTKTTFQRSSFALTRLLANLGATFDTPLLARFGQAPGADAKPWLKGLYLDEPVEQDDPYRYYCW
jgi:beta-galactosidase